VPDLVVKNVPAGGKLSSTRKFLPEVKRTG